MKGLVMSFVIDKTGKGMHAKRARCIKNGPDKFNIDKNL